MTAEEIIAARRCNDLRCMCQKARPGRGHVHCPAHEDEKPSLSIDDCDGRTVWYCHAGCSQEAVCDALGRCGLRLDRSEGSISDQRIVGIYDYRDERGKLLFQVVRYQPKAFRQRRPDGAEGWIWNLQGVQRVPYRLPELLVGIANRQAVFVVEGEKDADRLAHFGLIATTNPGGAGKWRDEYVPYFGGARVVVLPDADPAGRAHSRQVARSLQSVATEVKAVDIPGLPPKGDVSTWFDQGHTIEELQHLVNAAPVWQPILEPLGIRIADVQLEQVRWLWPGRVPLGKLTILDGDPGMGKSLIALDLAARVSTGKTMPDGTGSDLERPHGVVLLTAEDDLGDTIRPRLEAAGADLERVLALPRISDGVNGDRLPTLADLDVIEAAIGQVDAALLIVDPLMAYLPPTNDSHRDQDVRRTLAPLAALAARTGAATLCIRHLNKTGGGNPLYRGGGSIGIIGAARAGLLAAKDPSQPEGDRRVLAVTKSNLAVSAPALAYRVDGSGGVASVVWEGQSDHSAEALLAIRGSPEEQSALEEAMQFLLEVLAQGPVAAQQVLAEARGAGIKERTLRRAKSSLGVGAQKSGFAEGWAWELPGSKAAKMPGRLPIQGDSSLRGRWQPSEAEPSPPPERSGDRSAEAADSTGDDTRLPHLAAVAQRLFNGEIIENRLLRGSGT